MSDRQRCVTADRPEADQVRSLNLIADAASITTPSPAVRAYLRTFGLVAIVVYPDGSIGITQDVGRPLYAVPCAIWWCSQAHQAIEIKAQAEAEHTDDVCTVARDFGVTLAAHADVIARAEQAVRRLDDRLERAKANGLLKSFNRAFAARRLEARRRGQRFPQYAVCFDRLRRELYAAASGSVDVGMIERALGTTAKQQEVKP